MSTLGSAGSLRNHRVDVIDPALDRRGRLLVLYGRLLGPLLAGYLLFDRAFAYLHLPGSPLFVSEMLLALGIVAVLAATGYLRIPFRDEPTLTLLGLFVLWGMVRAVPGVGSYGIDAIRDSALWYYGVFAFLAVAALARSPKLLDLLLAQFTRLMPWLLLWLPLAVLLTPSADNAPRVPFSTVSVLSHKPGNAAIAALLVLWCVVLFPERAGPRMRAVCGMLALLVIALAATQNRGGLLGAVAGSAVGLVFLRERLKLVTQAIAICAAALVVALLVAPAITFSGVQGRAFSPDQLIDNVTSVGGGETSGSNLSGTVDGREELWTRILDKQVRDGLLVIGSGFGPNLAADVGVYDEGKETLRSPHNSHLHIMARMGLIGLTLWISLWLGWYSSVVTGCRRLAREGRHLRSRIGVLTLTVITAIHVSSFFDPQLEGPQISMLLWTLFGVGVAATSFRSWFSGGSSAADSGLPAHLAPAGRRRD